MKWSCLIRRSEASAVVAGGCHIPIGAWIAHSRLPKTWAYTASLPATKGEAMDVQARFEFNRNITAISVVNAFNGLDGLLFGVSSTMYFHIVSNYLLCRFSSTGWWFPNCVNNQRLWPMQFCRSWFSPCDDWIRSAELHLQSRIPHDVAGADLPRSVLPPLWFR